MRRTQNSVPVYNLPPLRTTQTPEKKQRYAELNKTYDKYSSVRETHNLKREDSEIAFLSAECYNRFDSSESDRYVDDNDLEPGRFMCSPAPREMSGDSINSSDSNGFKGRHNTSGFPSITVDRCDERHTSSNSSIQPKNDYKFENTDVVTSLLVPSTAMQRKYKDGRPVVITHNLEALKAFSKSDGHLNEIHRTLPTSPRSEGKRLDTSFRPQVATRPVIQMSREVSRDQVAEYKASRSPSPSPRRLRVRVPNDKQRARSTSDVNSRR